MKLYPAKQHDLICLSFMAGSFQNRCSSPSSKETEFSSVVAGIECDRLIFLDGSQTFNWPTSGRKAIWSTSGQKLSFGLKSQFYLAFELKPKDEEVTGSVPAENIFYKRQPFLNRLLSAHSYKNILYGDLMR